MDHSCSVHSYVTTIEEHQRLIDSLESVGIEVVPNGVFCGEEPVDGAYFPINSVLVVCQDYSSSISSKEVEWTPNDLDTLRHEYTMWYKIVRKVFLVIVKVLYYLMRKESLILLSSIFPLTDKQIENIIESYRERGDDETIVAELEPLPARSVVLDTTS